MHFGSALGMYRLAKSLGKECNIVTEPIGDSLGKFWEELNSIEEYKNAIVTEEEAIKLISNNTLLIVVDTHKTSFVEFPSILNVSKRKKGAKMYLCNEAMRRPRHAVRVDIVLQTALEGRAALALALKRGNGETSVRI